MLRFSDMKAFCTRRLSNHDSEAIVLQGSATFGVLSFPPDLENFSMGNIRESFTTAKRKRKSTSDALTVELDRATRREIGKIAKRAGQAETAVAAEVLAAYVKQQAWFADKIERTRRSPLVPDWDVEAFFRRWQKPALR